MSRRAVPLVAALAVWGGCDHRLALTPPIGPGTRSVIVVVETQDGRLLEAIDRDAAPTRTLEIGNEGDLEVWTLAYRAPLFDLNLRPGPITLGDGSPLPPAQSILHSMIRGDQASDWAEETELPERLADIRIQDVSTEQCLLEGGCLAERVPTVFACIVPCPRPEPPEPPTPPEAPRLADCPAGWTLEQSDDLRYCEPGPQHAPTCSAGEVLLPGAPTCAPLLHPCAGRFPTELPGGAIIRYVDPSAGAGGDGSLGAPYSTLEVALVQAPAGAVLALAQGRYAERLTLAGDRTLIGACPGGTILAPPQQAGLPTISIQGGRVALEGLSVEGDSTALYVWNGGLSLHGVELIGPGAGGGVQATGSRVDLRRVRIHGFSSGVVADGGASLNLEEVALEQIVGDAVAAHGVAEMTTRALLIDRSLGYGVWITGTSWIGRELWVSRGSRGLFLDAVATASVSDVVLADLSSSGLFARGDSRFEGRRVRIDRYFGAAVATYQSPAEFRLVDLLIRDGRGGLGLPNGRAFELFGAGRLSVERGLILRAAANGVFARGLSTEVELIDVRIQQTQPGNDFGNGPGLYLYEGATVSGRRVDLYANYNHGILMETGQLELDDLHVRNTRPRTLDNGFGRGVELFGGARFTSTRIRIANNHSVGLYAFDGRTTATLRDLEVTGTSTSTCIGFSCNAGVADGLAVGLSGAIDAERFDIHDNPLYGVRFVNDESRLLLRDGRIAGHDTGAQIISNTYDLRNLAKGVLFEDNPRILELLRADQ